MKLNFSKKFFSKFNLCLASSIQSKKFLEKLGVKKVLFLGNLKFAETEKEIKEINKNLKKNLNSKKIWCASSTHETEEDICGKVHIKLKKKHKTDKDWLEARSLFLDSYSKAPTYDDALCNYAHISVKLRDFKHAYEELLKRKKKGYNPKINEALARIYFFEGKIDDTLELFKETEENDHLTPITASHFLSTMNYSENFSQEEYLKYLLVI